MPALEPALLPGGWVQPRTRLRHGPVVAVVAVARGVQQGGCGLQPVQTHVSVAGPGTNTSLKKCCGATPRSAQAFFTAVTMAGDPQQYTS